MHTTKVVLLVEDDGAWLDDLKKALEADGFSVVSAQDGAVALAKIAEQHFDLILLDLILPKISGLDVLARVKADPKTKNTPVCIISALSDQDSISRGISLGAAGYLVKSNYGVEEMVRKAKECIGQQ